MFDGRPEGETPKSCPALHAIGVGSVQVAGVVKPPERCPSPSHLCLLAPAIQNTANVRRELLRCRSWWKFAAAKFKNVNIAAFFWRANYPQMSSKTELTIGIMYTNVPVTKMLNR
jgi:hypothetical protein